MGRRMPITSFKITDLKFQIWPYSTIPICLAIAQFERERERENTERARIMANCCSHIHDSLSLSLFKWDKTAIAENTARFLFPRRRLLNGPENNIKPR